MKSLTKIVLLLAGWISLCCVGNCQTTTITGIVTDPDGQNWNNGTISGIFQTVPSFPNISDYSINGVTLTAANSHFSGTLDSGGAFSIPGLYTNSLVFPIGTTWSITVCPQMSAPCQVLPNVMLTGGTQNLTSFITASLKAPRYNALYTNTFGSYGYQDVEVNTPPMIGAIYYNVISGIQRIWTGSAWANNGGGGGGGGVSSVGLTMPSWLAVSGTPITTSGTFGVTPATAQTSHQVIGTCGTATTFTPCALVPGDIPALSYGNTTSTSLTTNSLPKANGANSLINSLYTDDGTNGVYGGTGTFTVPALNSTGPVSVGSSPPTACGSATGCHAFSEASIAGTPTAAQDYIRADSTNHVFKFSVNNSAEAPLPLTVSSPLAISAAGQVSINANGIGASQLATQYSKGSCTELWGGSGASFALTSGDDAIVNNACYNDSGVTRTITAVKCRSDNGTNTTTVNPTFGSAGTGTTILSGALTCGSSLAYSSSGTVSNSAWTTGSGITPVMGGTLTGTSIAMIVEYTF